MLSTGVERIVNKACFLKIQAQSLPDPMIASSHGTALFDRWERIVQFYTGRGLRAHLLLSFYPLIKVLQLEHS